MGENWCIIKYCWVIVLNLEKYFENIGFFLMGWYGFKMLLEFINLF